MLSKAACSEYYLNRASEGIFSEDNMICASDLDRVAGPCMVRKLSLTSVSTTSGQRDIRVVVVVIVLSLLLHGTWASKV